MSIENFYFYIFNGNICYTNKIKIISIYKRFIVSILIIFYTVKKYNSYFDLFIKYIIQMYTYI